MNGENERELYTADFRILSKNRGHKLAYYAVRASKVNVHNNGCEKDNISVMEFEFFLFHLYFLSFRNLFRD